MLQEAMLVIENRLSELARVERWLAETLSAWSIPERAAFALDLVMNEAVTNLVNHAYRDPEVHEIQILLRGRGDWVEIELSDDGEAFDPCTAPVVAAPRIARNFMRLFADRLRARTAVIQHALEQRLRYEHMQRELGIARDIQLGMLPTHLDLGPEIDIAARMTPAQEVGGDFYDVFPVGPDEHCIAIGSPIPSPRPSSPSRMGHRGQTTSPWWCSGMSGISRWPG